MNIIPGELFSSTFLYTAHSSCGCLFLHHIFENNNKSNQIVTVRANIYSPNVNLLFVKKLKKTLFEHGSVNLCVRSDAYKTHYHIRGTQRGSFHAHTHRVYSSQLKSASVKNTGTVRMGGLILSD